MENGFFSKFIRSKIFAIIFICFSIFLIGYVSMKIGQIIEFVFSVKLYVVIFICLFMYFLYMLVYEKSKKKLKKTHKLYACCSLLLCLFINMIICFLVFDLISIVIKLNECSYVLALFIAIVFTAYSISHAKHIYIKEEKIHIGNKKKIKIAFLSDIHIGTFISVRQLDKIITNVNNLDADYVFIAGDIFNDDTFEYFDLKLFSDKLKELKPKGKVYAVLGNHDPDSNDERVYEFFKQSNIQLLVDEIRDLGDFYLIGRDDITSNNYRKSLSQLLNNIQKDKPLILLDHNPLGIKEAIEHKVNLILCGHTHQGQFFPATLFTRLSYGRLGFYGKNKKQNTNILVSSGVGFFQMPMRTGTKSEIISLSIEI